MRLSEGFKHADVMINWNLMNLFLLCYSNTRIYTRMMHNLSMGGGLKKLLIVAVLCFLVFFSISPALAEGQFELPGSYKTGPYIDKIQYRVISDSAEQMLALQNNDIDLIGDMIDPSLLPALQSLENIEVDNVWRNGYGYLTIKTDKYPFNITEFRRALAFAIDKQAISEDVWDGLSSPLDSCVPAVNPFSCEGLLPYTYYEANVELGNQLLDAAGFEISNVTGFRLRANGDPFDVLIEVPQSSNIAIEVGEMTAEALRALHVDATSQPTDFYEYASRLPPMYDYDIRFTTVDFNNFDVDWLAYEYWSEFAYELDFNLPCWQNTTYDSWRDQLLHATNYNDVYEAAFQMQEILVYQCPIIVCYENMLLSAYRTDKFEGYINDVSDGVPGWWTNYKVHIKLGETGAPWGGTFRWSNSLDINTFNIMRSSSAYTNNVLQMMYDSLLNAGPDGSDIPWLAEDWYIETHDVNPSVPIDCTRLTFDVLTNATWSDGQPLTAEDIAFTFNYYRDSPGNPFGGELTNMTAAYVPTENRVVIEFSSESYWHLHRIAYLSILPEHVFNEIGLENWSTWDPHPPIESMVTSGPFNVSDYVPGDFCELVYNPEYFYRYSSGEMTTTTTTTTYITVVSTSLTNPGIPYWSSTSTISPSSILTDTHGYWSTSTSLSPNGPNSPGLPYMTILSFSVTAGSLVVIIVFSYLIINDRKSLHSS